MVKVFEKCYVCLLLVLVFEGGVTSKHCLALLIHVHF